MWITRGRLRVLEAMLLLLASQAALRLVPFRYLTWMTGRVRPSDQGDAPAPPARGDRTAAVASAIRRGAARLPWHSTCLMRAMAGRLMLKRRGVPSTLVVGVARDAAGFRAHAWLVADTGTVCGGKDAPGFRPLASFGRERG